MKSLKLDIFKKKALSHNAEIKISKIPNNISVTSRGTQFTFNNQDYTIPLFGSHQARNAALAIDVVRHFDSKIKDDIIYNSLKTVFWPGRMQKVRQKVFYDVSHNKKGMEKILKNFKTLLISEDKKGLLQKFSILEQELAKVNIKCKTVSSIKKGSENIESLVKSNSSVGLIFGSHYIAEEVFHAFEIPFDNYYI